MKEVEPKREHSNDVRNVESPNRPFGGSRVDEWNLVLIDQVVQSHCTGNFPKDKREVQSVATIAALGGIQPKDELEGMMAAQLIAAHNATMECHRRGMLAIGVIESGHRVWSRWSLAVLAQLRNAQINGA